MKNLIITYFLFTSFIFFAQPKKAGLSNAVVQNMVTTLQHDTCLNKKFSIVFYVVLDSNYSPGAATTATLTQLVNNLNTAFKRICVQFLNCSTVYIPVYPYNKWKKNITDPVVRANWYTDKTINIYIVDSVKNQPFSEPYGYAYPPPPVSATTSTDAIVIEKNQLLSTNLAGFTSSIPLHLMGDFFGLPHTFDEIGSAITPAPPAPVGSYEFVNRTNCYAHGDGFCDTEADCFPAGNNIYGSNIVCGYVSGIKDGNNEYYVPPTDNFMSQYLCRCRYSQEQYNYMAYIILTRRLYLH